MGKRVSFTPRRLQTLPLPSDGRAAFYDDTVRGLMVEVTPSGTKSFRVYRKFRGRPIKITLGVFDSDVPETRDLPDGAAPLDLLGNYPSLNVRMARKLAIAVIAELDTGVNPVETTSQARKGMALGEMFKKYKSYLKGDGRKTVPALVWTWERYLGELPESAKKPHGAERTKAPGGVDWERRHLGEITHEQVSRLRLDLGEKVGRTTANRVIELLRAMYNFAKKQRLYQGENPAAGNGKFHLPSRERYLQADEANKFFKALDSHQDQDFADFVRVALYTGARRGNVLRMRWDEVNLDGARWTLSGERMKNGENLTVPLVSETVAVLRRRAEKKNGAEWVFPGNNPAGHMGPPKKKWKKLAAAAEVPDLHFHDLRRSLGSWMASNGANTVLTMRALGHKTIDAALIYQRLAADPVREAMQKAVSAIAQAAANGDKPENAGEQK
jgi:integrase